MLLSDEEHFAIILSAIRDYQEGVNDIPILIVEKVSAQIINCVKDSFSTQDIYDEIEECFNFFNDFIKEKDINLKPIDSGFFDLVVAYLNTVIEEYDKNGTNMEKK